MTLTENLNRPGAHVLHEQHTQFSRESGVTVSGGNYLAGTVLGRITDSGDYTQLNPGADDGSGVAVAVLFSAVDASDGGKPGTINDLATLYDDRLLVWPEGITEEQKATAIDQLRAAQQKVRSY
ncbi:head decoration protein [Microbulbifer sp. 2205BS26-8]|uniref:head decoration protein n=1 Tax=Microbulbifer sp. 2205BS26-8 TaxID=3064386 RepID=UPI0027402ED6|nr:head decoration protein [Microbulbifer sp. 2205BS26-8]MDP5210001.1 head decoration protein [Microbulbifer sp. 2205BS26-8]